MPEANVRMKFRAVTAVEEAVRRYPEDPMSWYELGEWRMGTQPWPIAGPPAVSLEAFTRAIALDPGFGPAYEHMPALLLSLGRPEEARRYAATYLALDPTSPHRSEIRLAALLLDSSATGRAEAERMLDTASVFTVWGAAINQGLASWPDTAETAIRLLRRLGEPGRGAGGGLRGSSTRSCGRSTWLMRSRSAATCARPSPWMSACCGSLPPRRGAASSTPS